MVLDEGKAAARDRKQSVEELMRSLHCSFVFHDISLSFRSHSANILQREISHFNNAVEEEKGSIIILANLFITCKCFFRQHSSSTIKKNYNINVHTIKIIITITTTNEWLAFWTWFRANIPFYLRPTFERSFFFCCSKQQQPARDCKFLI